VQLKSHLDVKQSALSLFNTEVRPKQDNKVCAKYYIGKHEFGHTVVALKSNIDVQQTALSLLKTEVKLNQENEVWANYYIYNYDFGHTLLCYLSLT